MTKQKEKEVKEKEIKENNKNLKDYEEPNYGKTICACVLIIAILVIGYLSYKKIYDKNKTIIPAITYTADEKRFKKEYESLNGKVNINDEILKDVDIAEDNNVKYVSLSEAVNIMKNDQGIIFFAFPTNQKSRIASETLIDAMNSTDLDKIYYLNVRPDDQEASDIRDTYIINKKKVQKSKDASDSYYELLKLLDKYLPKYTLINSNGDSVYTGEKRLSVPTVVSFNKGHIGKYVEGTVINHEYDKDGVLRDLTQEEVKELNEKYVDLITDYLETGCSIEEESGC